MANPADNNAFWTGFLLSVFAGPVIGAIPLCLSATRDMRYRAYYLRGMSVSAAVYGVVVAIIAIALGKSCQSSPETSIYSDGNGSYYAYTSYYNCSAIYQQLLPLAIFWTIVAIALRRQSNALLNALQLIPIAQMIINTNPNQAQMTGVISSPGQTNYYQPPSQPPPSDLPAYSPYEEKPGYIEVNKSTGTDASIPYNNQIENPANNGYSVHAGQPSSSSQNYAQTYAGSLEQPISIASMNTPVNISQYTNGQYAPPAGPPPDLPTSTPDPPAPLNATMSLESLALQLQIPKLLEVTEGPAGVLSLSYQELKDRYGITAEEFLRIKGYRKNFGMN